MKGFEVNDGKAKYAWIGIPLCIADIAGCVFIGKHAKTKAGKILGILGNLTAFEGVAYMITRHSVKKDAEKKGYTFKKYSVKDYYQTSFIDADTTAENLKEKGIIE